MRIFVRLIGTILVLMFIFWTLMRAIHHDDFSGVPVLVLATIITVGVIGYRRAREGGMSAK